MTTHPTRLARKCAVVLILGAALAPQASHAAGVGVASPSAGRLDVVIRHDGNGTGTDPNQDSLVELTRLNGEWQAPQNIGGFVDKDSEIGLTSRATGTLDLVTRSTDGSIKWRSWTAGNGWGSWTTIGTGSTGGPSITTWGTGKLAAVWRNATGKVAIRSWTSGTGWAAEGTLAWTVRADTAPTIQPLGTNGLQIAQNYSTFKAPTTADFTGTGAPETQANWTSPVFNPAVATPALQTNSLGAAHLIGGGTGRELVQVIPDTDTTTGGYVSLGGVVAGSATTSRPGESTIPNTPGSAWAFVNSADTTKRADLFYRTDNGCLSSRTKTSTVETAAWTAATAVPSQVAASRCVWPPRTGTLPLMKRNSSGDTADYQAAHASWWSTPVAGNPQRDWFSQRFGSVVFDNSPDWATSWGPRNWLPNAWMYRKSTSYGEWDGLQNVAPTNAYFVRAGNDNHLLAVNYGCTPEVKDANGNVTTAGYCSQPLLNVTLPAARKYWLYGPDGVVTSQGGCHNEASTDGVLDFLACKNGPTGSTNTNIGNVKGLWLDDVLAELNDGAVVNPTANSHVADAVTGKPVRNDQLATRLPTGVTQTTWENGLAQMLEDLKAGIATLKSNGTILPSQGQVAINYKWSTYGFATASTTPTISPTSAAGRIIKAASLVELEGGWIDGGLAPGGAVQWSYQRKQAFVDQVHSLGTKVLEEKTVCAALPEYASTDCDRRYATQNAANDQAHYKAAQYNLASTLLDYSAGDWVGDLTEYYNRGWNGYQLDLGAPTGARTFVTADVNGAQQRLFERGRVIAVPPGVTGTVTVTVPTGSRWYATGSNPLSTVTGTTISLTARQGAVLLNP